MQALRVFLINSNHTRKQTFESFFAIYEFSIWLHSQISSMLQKFQNKFMSGLFPIHLEETQCFVFEPLFGWPCTTRILFYKNV